ncbi:hypothetical protein STRATTON_142 [Erwinia phage vB_EamM_Stratton]|uniref:Uncharacterized protein n=1 Tax=Erwinia phage vB_EamM_Stratton TaxID=1883378 RepID=A0A1B2IH18_9CAUD|nr:hypothetical protein STRATTON_142 [Erwinia phage vB_EamM_Stratton]
MTQKVQNSGMSGAIGKNLFKVACVEVATDVEGEGEVKLMRRVIDLVNKHNESDADFKLEILPIPRWPFGQRTMIVFERFMNCLRTFESDPNRTSAAMLESASVLAANFDKPVAVVGAGRPIGQGFLSELIKRNAR